jgi:hypothetical protein
VSAQSKNTPNKGPRLIPLLMVGIGVVLLLWNYLLIDFFSPIVLLPLFFVVVGLQILLQGDFIPNREVRTFGITRGSVQEATLEIHAGDVDVNLGAFPEEQQERLIAGQYAPQARPALEAEGVHAHLTFDRTQTSWLAMSDWDMALVQQLPWRIYVSSNLGQIRADLADIITDEIKLSTGIGDIHCTTPKESFQPITLKSTLGDIHVISPEYQNVTIYVESSRFLRLQYNTNRYQVIETSDGTAYTTVDKDDDAPEVTLYVTSRYGSIYLT